jgi:hypothetical protein
MRNATRAKLVAKTPASFAVDQFLEMHPLFLPFWIAGLVHLFGNADGRRHRIQAWIWISVFALLAFTGSVRANYLGPAYAPVLAAGGVAFERLATRPRWRWLPAAMASVFVIGGLALAPLAMPLLPPHRYVAYERLLGLSAPDEEHRDYGAMPPHFAPRFGWPDVLDAVEQAHSTLSPRERAHAVVLGSRYGDTAAVNFFGPERGLPRAISGHNSYWLWGPGDPQAEVVLALSADGDSLARSFDEVEPVAEVECDYCTPDVDRLRVYVCRGRRQPLASWWLEMKRYE